MVALDGLGLIPDECRLLVVASVDTRIIRTVKYPLSI